MADVKMTIGDWTFIEVGHPITPPMMYVHHNCDDMGILDGSITRCNKCKMLVPDDIRGLLTMYNWNHPWNWNHPGGDPPWNRGMT